MSSVGVGLRSLSTAHIPGRGTVKYMHPPDAAHLRVGSCVAIDGDSWRVVGIERPMPPRYMETGLLVTQEGRANMLPDPMCVPPPPMPLMEERIANLTAANNEMALLLARETRRADKAEAHVITLESALVAMRRDVMKAVRDACATPGLEWPRGKQIVADVFAALGITETP